VCVCMGACEKEREEVERGIEVAHQYQVLETSMRLITSR